MNLGQSCCNFYNMIVDYSYVKPFSLTPNGSSYEMMNIWISHIVTAGWSNKSQQAWKSSGLLQFEPWPLRYWCSAFRVRCVFNRNNLAFLSSFRGSNRKLMYFYHFIFIFPCYNTNKFNDQLPGTWLADPNWLEPCIGIPVSVNHGNAPIFLGFFKQLHKLNWSSSTLASHQGPINALELSKYWELNHKLTIKFLN